MLGAVLPARRDRVRAMLPDGLRAIRPTPRTAAVTLLSVEYRRIGDGQIDPYDEFAVVVPAVPTGAVSLPILSTITQGTNGYVWWMPVTSDPAKALGVDVWGYPKAVGEISHEDDGERRRTTVAVDGERILSLTVERPPTVDRRDSGHTYTVADGTLLRVPNEIDGAMGGWPYSSRVSLSFGEHPRADRLRALGLGERALVRFAIDGEARFYPGEAVDGG